MPFRIAIGTCGCSDESRSLDPLAGELCSRIVAGLEQLRSYAPEVLRRLPAFSTSLERIAGRKATLTTYCDVLKSGDVLVVVQGFISSWRFPTYIGSAGVGHMCADGILVTIEGRLDKPDDDLLWPFR
jgi:hypothetical protein